MGVVLEAGTHRVEMVYFPRGLAAGLALAGLAGAGLLGFLVRGASRV